MALSEAAQRPAQKDEERPGRGGGPKEVMRHHGACGLAARPYPAQHLLARWVAAVANPPARSAGENRGAGLGRRPDADGAIVTPGDDAVERGSCTPDGVANRLPLLGFMEFPTRARCVNTIRSAVMLPRSLKKSP
jgi:hypothetical protein